MAQLIGLVYMFAVVEVIGLVIIHNIKLDFVEVIGQVKALRVVEAIHLVRVIGVTVLGYLAGLLAWGG